MIFVAVWNLSITYYGHAINRQLHVFVIVHILYSLILEVRGVQLYICNGCTFKITYKICTLYYAAISVSLRSLLDSSSDLSHIWLHNIHQCSKGWNEPMVSSLSIILTLLHIYSQATESNPINIVWKVWFVSNW